MILIYIPQQTTILIDGYDTKKEKFIADIIKKSLETEFKIVIKR